MSAKKTVGFGPLTRRDFIRTGGSGVAGFVAARALPRAAEAADDGAAYPVLDVAPAAALQPGETLDFSYPDADSPALLLRLAGPVEDGAGPARDLVAYSILCTHKGCPVAYKAEHGLLICPCHWSTFDPAKSGALVIGQASQALPRIALRVADGMVQATGVSGLIYGRHTNIL